MISPQGRHQTFVRDFARRVDHGSGTIRPAPRGSTFWWAVRAAAVAAAMVISCAGFAGVMQSASMRCRDVGYRVCLSLVVDDLTGKSKPASRAD